MLRRAIVLTDRCITSGGVGGSDPEEEAAGSIRERQKLVKPAVAA